MIQHLYHCLLPAAPVLAVTAVRYLYSPHSLHIPALTSPLAIYQTSQQCVGVVRYDAMVDPIATVHVSHWESEP